MPRIVQPQLVKRRAGTTKSETRRLSAAECEQRVGELQPGSGRLERCAVLFEERGALLEPRARLIVLSFSGKKKAVCVGDRGFEWLGSDYCRYRAQLFESDSGRIQVALRDSCTDQDIQTQYPLRSILRRNAAEIFLGEIGSLSQLPAVERQRRAAQQPQIVGAGSGEEVVGLLPAALPPAQVPQADECDGHEPGLNPFHMAMQGLDFPFGLSP